MLKVQAAFLMQMTGWYLTPVDTARVPHADMDLRPSGTAEKFTGNCGYGLLAMPGGRGLGRQVLQASDDGRGAELP